MPQRQLDLFDFAEAIAFAKLWREQHAGADHEDENQFVVDGVRHMGDVAARKALEEKLHYAWHVQVKAERAEDRVRRSRAGIVAAPATPPAVFPFVGDTPERRAPEFTPWAAGYENLRQSMRMVRQGKPVDVAPSQFVIEDLDRVLRDGLQLPEEMVRYFRTEWLPNHGDPALYTRVVEILRNRLDPLRKEEHAIYVAAKRREHGVKPKKRSGKVLKL